MKSIFNSGIGLEKDGVEGEQNNPKTELLSHLGIPSVQVQFVHIQFCMAAHCMNLP